MKNGILNKEEFIKFEKLSKPLIKFLNDYCEPHCQIIIECNCAQLLSGVAAINIAEFIKD